jgi:hypothetical protein
VVKFAFSASAEDNSAQIPSASFGRSESDAGLLFNQRTLKDRSRIKACVIRPPKTPAVSILFLNCQLDEQMRSAFLVFDLIGRNVRLKR